jgi:hypothetical protein
MVSLFRSHLVALEISGRLSGVTIEELFDNEIYITTGEFGVLSIWINTECGDGSVRVITEDVDTAGPWSMSIDGTITLNGESLEMEFAVERFAAMLLKK